MAVNACRLISMDPERMGEHICIECSGDLNEFLSQIPEELRDDYEAKYLQKWREWLAALGRCYSVLVTGPARFNNRRHDRMNDYERAAKQRLQDWREKVVKRINRQERLTGWQEVERLQNKLDTLTEWHEQMKAANKIIKSKSLTEDEQREELSASDGELLDALRSELELRLRCPLAVVLVRNHIRESEVLVKRKVERGGRERGVHQCHRFALL